MHDLRHQGSAGLHSSSSRDELVESLRADFQALDGIMARQELQGDALECVVRVRVAIDDGLELIDRLSFDEPPVQASRSFR